jgi:hypothetical protein
MRIAPSGLLFESATAARNLPGQIASATDIVQRQPNQLCGRFASRIFPVAECAGRMEIVLVSGRRIVADTSVDTAVLDRVITVLERR